MLLTLTDNKLAAERYQTRKDAELVAAMLKNNFILLMQDINPLSLFPINVGIGHWILVYSCNNIELGYYFDIHS